MSSLRAAKLCPSKLTAVELMEKHFVTMFPGNHKGSVSEYLSICVLRLIKTRLCTKRRSVQLSKNKSTSHDPKAPQQTDLCEGYKHSADTHVLLRT